MLEHRTFRGNEEELNAYAALIEEHGGDAILGVTRTEPNEGGPLRVEFADGRAFTIAEDGTTDEYVEEGSQ